VRVLTYVAFEDAGRPLLLRFSTAAPDLEAGLRERQQALIAHVAALTMLVFAAGLALLPDRSAADAGTTPRVLQAYEQAMERLRDRGEEMSREHSAERQRMEGEMHDQAAMARAGELTAGIVHEMRNGLGTILGYARLLEREGTGEAQEAAGSIRKECETLEAVIRRFTDYVRRDTLNLASVDLGRLLSRVVARESRGDARAMSLQVEGERAALVADEEMLERAFENLVRNAREAAGPRGKVSVRVWQEGEKVGVRVEDDGTGFPEDVGAGPRPFFTTKPGGLGLGLPLVHKIVRLHQGALLLRGRHPRGAVAEVWLPEGGPGVVDSAGSDGEAF
jgi:signal transduction histidine kinase